MLKKKTPLSLSQIKGKTQQTMKTTRRWARHSLEKLKKGQVQSCNGNEFAGKNRQGGYDLLKGISQGTANASGEGQLQTKRGERKGVGYFI